MRLGYKVLENGLGIVPDRLTKIDSFAFYGCKTLRKIRIPEGITTIGSKAFCGCSSLEEVELPKSLITIESKAFYKCPVLNRVSLARNGGLNVAWNAFKKCPYFSGITRPGDIAATDDREQETKLSDEAEETVKAQEQETKCSEEAAEAVKAQEQETKCSEEVVEAVQEQEQESSVETVEAEAATVKTKIEMFEYYKRDDLKEFIIPDGITEIGDNAFSDCKSLKKIIIPKSVAEIGSSAFEGCESLKNIDIPYGVAKINSFTFSGCKHLKNVTIPNSVTEICNTAFAGCRSLERIVIPDSVKSIGEYAFTYCTAIKEINIPDGVTSIASFAFADCTSLYRVTIPRSVVEIGATAFANCDSLLIKLPNGKATNKIPLKYRLRKIIGKSSNSALSRKISYKITETELSSGKVVTTIVKEITLSDGTVIRKTAEKTKLHKKPFSDREEPNEYIISDDVNEIGDFVFWNSKNLKKVVIPNSVTIIGKDAFANCESLESVNIPDGVTCINKETFKNCKMLKTITIPNSVTFIGYCAFCGCESLESITLLNKDCKIDCSAFSRCKSLKEIKYSNGRVTDAKTFISGNDELTEIPEYIKIGHNGKGDVLWTLTKDLAGTVVYERTIGGQEQTGYERRDFRDTYSEYHVDNWESWLSEEDRRYIKKTDVYSTIEHTWMDPIDRRPDAIGTDEIVFAQLYFDVDKLIEGMKNNVIKFGLG